MMRDIPGNRCSENTSGLMKIAAARAAATCQKTLAFTALDGARHGRLFVAVQILVQRFAPFLFKKLAKFCGGRIAFSEVLAVLLPQRAYERVAAFLTNRAVLVAMATIESVFFFSHGKYSTEKSPVMITLPCTLRKWVSKKRVAGGRVGDAEGAVRGNAGACGK